MLMWWWWASITYKNDDDDWCWWWDLGRHHRASAVQSLRKQSKVPLNLLTALHRSLSLFVIFAKKDLIKSRPTETYYFIFVPILNHYFSVKAALFTPSRSLRTATTFNFNCLNCPTTDAPPTPFPLLRLLLAGEILLDLLLDASLFSLSSWLILPQYEEDSGLLKPQDSLR